MKMNYENWMDSAGHFFKLEAMHMRRNNGVPDFVDFYPYIESYGEQFNSQWNQEDVYGRMDGINNFVNVKRIINLTIRLVAADLEQAKDNMYKISKMVRFLYPAISSDGSVNNIRTAPILRLRLGNLIIDNATKGGLFGFINGGFSINPIHKDGYFTPIRTVDVVDGKGGKKREKADPLRDMQSSPESVIMLWKHVDISFSFSVVHNHSLGNSISNATIDPKDPNSTPIGEGSTVFRYYPYDINSEDVGRADPFPITQPNPSEEPQWQSREDPRILEERKQNDDKNKKRNMDMLNKYNDSVKSKMFSR